MHDPYSEILRVGPFTLWHKDPETDGSDDSCGMFQRLRHLDQGLYQKVLRDFEFHFKHNYWFTADGTPKFSTPGTVLIMYRTAAWKIFYPSRRKFDRFFRMHLHNILHFAENDFDSLHNAITREMYYRTVEHDRSQVESRQERIAYLASVVYCDIMRKLRPWYKHPRWHVHHWRLSFNKYQLPLGIGKLLWSMQPKEEMPQVADENLRDTV